MHLGKFKCARNPLYNENRRRTTVISQRKRTYLFDMCFKVYLVVSPLKISWEFSSNSVYFRRESREGLTNSWTLSKIMISYLLLLRSNVTRKSSGLQLVRACWCYATSYSSMFSFVLQNHLKVCQRFPVQCTKCGSRQIPREKVCLHRL